MTPEEFQSLYPQVIGWIHQTLAAHAKEAKAVASLGFRRLSRYFSEELLTSTKVVVINRVPMPALSSMGLSQFAEFERGDYEGITYLDTFFVKRRGAAVEWLHFHELIHVIQWRLLGPEAFLAVYAAGLETFGYRESWRLLAIAKARWRSWPTTLRRHFVSPTNSSTQRSWSRIN